MIEMKVCMYPPFETRNNMLHHYAEPACFWSMGMEEKLRVVRSIVILSE